MDYVHYEILSQILLLWNTEAKSFQQKNANIEWSQCTLDEIIFISLILTRTPSWMLGERALKPDLQIIAVIR